MESAIKVIASVFWCAKGIFLIDYLEKGGIIKFEYKCYLLNQPKEKNCEKTPG